MMLRFLSRPWLRWENLGYMGRGRLWSSILVDRRWRRLRRGRRRSSSSSLLIMLVAEHPSFPLLWWHCRDGNLGTSQCDCVVATERDRTGGSSCRSTDTFLRAIARVSSSAFSSNSYVASLLRVEREVSVDRPFFATASRRAPSPRPVFRHITWLYGCTISLIHLFLLL